MSCEIPIGYSELILHISNILSQILSLSKTLCGEEFLDFIFQFFYLIFSFKSFVEL